MMLRFSTPTQSRDPSSSSLVGKATKVKGPYPSLLRSKRSKMLELETAEESVTCRTTMMVDKKCPSETSSCCSEVPSLLLDHSSPMLNGFDGSHGDSHTPCLLYQDIMGDDPCSIGGEGPPSSNDGSECSSSSYTSSSNTTEVDVLAPSRKGASSMMSRTKSLFSFGASVTAPSSSLTRGETATLVSEETLPRNKDFSSDVRAYRQSPQLQEENSVRDVTDNSFRSMLEPHLRGARLSRETCRLERGARELANPPSSSFPQPDSHTFSHHHRSIADSVGVPYTGLRHERAFLFDEHSYPLHHILAQALQVEDLTRLHERQQTSVSLVESLLRHPDKRKAFHAAYDGFVTTFCIPLLHSLAMTKNVFHSSSATDQVVYRYQAFPTIRVVQPNDPAMPPVCDTALGHSIGCLHFCIPLTPSDGNHCAENANLFVESHPGREDWHPLQTRAFGLGHLFDGARCLYFDLGGGSGNATRVSLHFRILLYREIHGRNRAPNHESGDGLCPLHLVDDACSRQDSNFYEEVVIDMGRRRPYNNSFSRCNDIVMKKHGDRLLPVSSLVLSPPLVFGG